MSRLHLHRWAVIFLLVSKLIFGEFAHAMPHVAAPASATDQAAAPADHEKPPCGNHVESGSASTSDPSQDSSTDPADKSCCESGGCACPCLHSPAAAATVPFTMPCANADQVAVLVKGAVWHRLSALFRPPA